MASNTTTFALAQFQEANVASGATTDIFAATKARIAITGSTGPVTSLGTGIWRIRFCRVVTGGFQITYNATTLITPTAKNIVTQAGDTFTVMSDASSNARIIEYTRASGSPLTEMFFPPQGRLTLTTNVPVLVANALAQTTIYYTPHFGQFVPIYDGTRFVMTDIGGQLSQTTTDNTKSPAAVANNSNYDLFIWNDAGTIRCTRGPAWTSDTGRGTGAGTTQLTRISGLLTNTVAITNGPAASRGLYVGTVRSNGSAQIDWQIGALSTGGTPGIFGVWNMYNRVLVQTMVRDDTNSWTCAAGTTQAANNSTGNRVSFVSGWEEDTFLAHYQAFVTTAGGGTTCSVGVGIDVVNAFSGRFGQMNLASTTQSKEGDAVMTALGFHFMSAVESSVTGTTTFYGDNGGTVVQTGLMFNGRF